jgi:hemoglobin
MNVIRESDISLAHAIGLCRIAKVVDQFCDEIASHPDLEEPFRVIGNCPDRKARLTYFWWVTLGGKTSRGMQCDLVPKHIRAGFAGKLMGEWTTLFRRVACSVLDRQLAEAWIERAARLGQSLQTSNGHRGTGMAATAAKYS